jgi:hypothetical protein
LIVPDPRAWLEERLGPLAYFEAAQPEAASPQPEPEPAAPASAEAGRPGLFEAEPVQALGQTADTLVTIDISAGAPLPITVEELIAWGDTDDGIERAPAQQQAGPPPYRLRLRCCRPPAVRLDCLSVAPALAPAWSHRREEGRVIGTAAQQWALGRAATRPKKETRLC